jgi:hypothetical protein
MPASLAPWLAAVLAAAAPGPATLDEVLARAHEARGGAARLRAVQSVRMIGRMAIGRGPEAPITIEKKRPRRSRMELSVQGMTGLQAFDGTRAWGIPPGGSKAEALPEEMARDLAARADIEGPLPDHEAKGHSLELVGREKLDGKDAYRLKLTYKTGEVEHVWLDAQSHLELRAEARRVVRGSAVELETRFSDYREAGGVLWPYRIESGPKGRAERQVITFSRIDVDPPLDDARFALPR